MSGGPSLPPSRLQANERDDLKDARFANGSPVRPSSARDRLAPHLATIRTNPTRFVGRGIAVAQVPLRAMLGLTESRGL